MYGTFELEFNELIKELKQIYGEVNAKLEPKIQELAKLLEKGLNEKNQKLINLMGKWLGREPEIKDICVFLYHWGEHEKIILGTDRYIRKILADKYKHTEFKAEQVPANITELEARWTAQADLVADEEVEVIYDTFKDRAENIKKRRESRSHDIRINEEKKEFGEYGCLLAELFESFAKRLREDHDKHHDRNLEKKSYRTIKSALDSRHVASEKEMESIILASEYTTSLKNVADGQSYVISRWDLESNESNCSQCGGDRRKCVKIQCPCICHVLLKKGTTKGIKFSINANEWLKQLKHDLRSMMDASFGNLCVIGSAIVNNPRTGKYLNNSDKLRALTDHISFHKCDLCLNYLEEHPDL